MLVESEAFQTRNAVGDQCVVTGTEEENIGLYKPHPYVCTSYLKCDHGYLILQHCDQYLHWNSEKEACDWPQLAGCDPNAVAPPAPSTTPSPPTTPRPEIVPPGVPGAVCVAGDDENNLGLYKPHPYDCSLFLKCEHGVLTIQKCPPRLHWNAWERACDWPQFAGCHVSDDGIPIPPIGQLPPSGDLPPLVGEPAYPGSPGAPNLGNPDNIPGNPNAISSCPLFDSLDYAIILPHPTCELYYKCEHGRPLTLRCPPGLHWNNKVLACDWPNVAGCIQGAVPEQPNAVPLPEIPPIQGPSPDSPGPGGYSYCPSSDPLLYSVVLPHPNCGIFYKCLHGQPVETLCPPGLHWSTVYAACDWPSLAGCVSNAAPQQPNAVLL